MFTVLPGKVIVFNRIKEKHDLLEVPVSWPYLEECDVCCKHQEYNLVKPAGLDLVPLFPSIKKDVLMQRILYQQCSS